MLKNARFCMCLQNAWHSVPEETTPQRKGSMLHLQQHKYRHSRCAQTLSWSLKASKLIVPLRKPTCTPKRNAKGWHATRHTPSMWEISCFSGQCVLAAKSRILQKWSTALSGNFVEHANKCSFFLHGFCSVPSTLLSRGLWKYCIRCFSRCTICMGASVHITSQMSFALTSHRRIHV